MTGCGGAPDDLVQRPPGLPQREVQRRGVERPAAVEARDLAAHRLGGEEVERVDALAEVAERRLAGERSDRPGRLQHVVVLGVVDDVLADALLAAALQVDDGRLAREAAGDVAHQALERVRLDGQRKVGEQVVGPHRRSAYALRCASAVAGARAAGSACALQPRDELVEPQLLEALADGLELACAHSTSRRPSATSSSVSRSPASPESSRRTISSMRALGALVAEGLGSAVAAVDIYVIAPHLRRGADATVVEAQLERARGARSLGRRDDSPARSSTIA